MAKRSKRRVTEKRRRKSSAAYLAGGGNSKYAQKQAEQKAGKFRPTSPFRGWATPKRAAS